MKSQFTPDQLRHIRRKEAREETLRYWKDFGATMDQIEAFEKLIEPGGSITGSHKDDLMLVCIAFSRYCADHECTDWLSFEAAGDWEQEVKESIYAR